MVMVVVVVVPVLVVRAQCVSPGRRLSEITMLRSRLASPGPAAGNPLAPAPTPVSYPTIHLRAACDKKTIGARRLDTRAHTHTHTHTDARTCVCGGCCSPRINYV